MIRRGIKALTTFAPWARWTIIAALALLAIGVAIRGGQAVRGLIFGNVEAHHERGGRIVAEEQVKPRRRSPTARSARCGNAKSSARK